MGSSEGGGGVGKMIISIGGVAWERGCWSTIEIALKTLCPLKNKHSVILRNRSVTQVDTKASTQWRIDLWHGRGTIKLIPSLEGLTKTQSCNEYIIIQALAKKLEISFGNVDKYFGDGFARKSSVCVNVHDEVQLNVLRSIEASN